MEKELVQEFMKYTAEKGLDIHGWKEAIDAYFEEYVSMDECDAYEVFALGEYDGKELWQVITVYHNNIECYPFWV